jgi:hypothetical protein
MIKAKIISIDLNTGVGTCVLDSNGKSIDFNVLKLQNGDQSSLYYNVKKDVDIFFDEDVMNDSKIDAPYYLEDFSEKFLIVKQIYSKHDRQPLIGDLVKTKSEGIKRVARIEDNIIQLGHGKPYLFMQHGETSYSGGLDYPVDASKLKDTGDMDTAMFWTFKDGARAHNGIDFQLKVKVWFLQKDN